MSEDAGVSENAVVDDAVVWEDDGVDDAVLIVHDLILPWGTKASQNLSSNTRITRIKLKNLKETSLPLSFLVLILEQSSSPQNLMESILMK